MTLGKKSGGGAIVISAPRHRRCRCRCLRRPVPEEEKPSSSPLLTATIEAASVAIVSCAAAAVAASPRRRWNPNHLQIRQESIEIFERRTVRHIGGAMRGAGADQISVLVRSVAESRVSKNALRLFYALGYRLDHELLRVGFSFHFQRGAQITVTVSSVNKMLKLHAIDEAVPVTPGIQLVEVTAPASGENYTEVVAAITSFCEHLAPLLHLSKPGVLTGVVPTAAAAAASLMSDGGGTVLQ